MSIPEAEGRRPHVVHLTSAHPRYDIRIFRKQCCSLAKSGFDVSMVVADGKGDEVTEEGIRIYDVGRIPGRINRIFRATRRVYARARSLDADLYQFHDPELLPAGLKLRRVGKIVIFDSHEDVPKQLMGKAYLIPIIRHVISWLFARYERSAAKRLNAVIGATPSITEKFRNMGAWSLNVNNFPQLGELDSELPWTDKADEVCYVGGISEIRGIFEMIEAVGKTKSRAKLNLVGEFSEADVEQSAHARSGWTSVNAYGFQDREGVRRVMERSVAGLVTLAPSPNHIDSQPIKMFEYMSAGIPVIASDFPLWRDIIMGSDCGVCVDPADPEAIAKAIDQFVFDRSNAARMGRNGKMAVEQKYNWSREAPKLVGLYRELLQT